MTRRLVCIVIRFELLASNVRSLEQSLSFSSKFSRKKGFQ